MYVSVRSVRFVVNQTKHFGDVLYETCQSQIGGRRTFKKRLGYPREVFLSLLWDWVADCFETFVFCTLSGNKGL